MRGAMVGVAVAVLMCGCRPPQLTGADAEKVVRAVIAEIMNVSPSAIVMDQPITQRPVKADDVDLIEFILELEERFAVEIPDEAIQNLAGVEKIEDAPARLTPNHLVSLVKTAFHDRKK